MDMMLDAMRDAADGGGHIAQGVHLLVGDGDLAALADDRNADLVDLPEKFFLRQARAGAGDSLHLVNRAARVAEAAPAHLGDLDTAGRHDGRNDQRRLITDAAGTVFVYLNALNLGQINHITGLCHTVRKNGQFLFRHTFIIHCHQKRRHLIIRYFSCHIAFYHICDLFRSKFRSFFLFVNNIIHSHCHSPFLSFLITTFYNKSPPKLSGSNSFNRYVLYSFSDFASMI